VSNEDDLPRLTDEVDESVASLPRGRKAKLPAKDRVAGLYTRRGPEFTKARKKLLAKKLKSKTKK
jgi:hypothetical protein